MPASQAGRRGFESHLPLQSHGSPPVFRSWFGIVRGLEPGARNVLFVHLTLPQVEFLRLMGAACIALNGKAHTRENRECKQTSTSSLSGEAAPSGNTGNCMPAEPAERAARIPVMAPHRDGH
jgi:hypothetical protein